MKIPAESAMVSCCSTFYEQDWVRHLAEDIFHPGGEALTRKTVTGMKLSPGASIVDLGCGTGTTAILLSNQFDFEVEAIDISAANIERASARVASEDRPIRFQQSGADSLPFRDREFDGVLAECTFSLFPDQMGALTEIHRVLKPHGHLAITDMAVGGQLPHDIAEVLAPWTCLKDAMDQGSYIKTFETAGFQVEEVADESLCLNQMILQLKRRLLLLGAGGLMMDHSFPAVDWATVRFWLNRFREEVDKGLIRYLRFQMRKRS